MAESVTESDFAYCDTRYHSVVSPSVCMLSVTLVRPAKAVGRNEMPFGRYSRLLDRDPGPLRDRRFGSQNPQFAAILPIAYNYFGFCYIYRVSYILVVTC